MTLSDSFEPIETYRADPSSCRCQVLFFEMNTMGQNHPSRINLLEIGGDPIQQLRFFTLLNLGIIQSLAGGAMSAEEAIQLFYNAENCLYVRKHFRNKHANVIMSHGVQLPDLFEALSNKEASREFFHELEKIRPLCMNLLTEKRSTRVVNMVAA